MQRANTSATLADFDRCQGLGYPPPSTVDSMKPALAKTPTRARNSRRCRGITSNRRSKSFKSRSSPGTGSKASFESWLASANPPSRSSSRKAVQFTLDRIRGQGVGSFPSLLAMARSQLLENRTGD